MKTIKSKKLVKKINTVCDFSTPFPRTLLGETDPPTGTDPTNTTVITLTTISGFNIAK
jgi:hypothetical protein